MLVTAACSGGQPQQASENDYVQPSAAPRTPVDAPTSFDVSAAVGMPDGSMAGNVALEKTTAFVNTANGVFVFDTGTERITNIADTTHKRASNWQGDKGFHAPLVANTSGGTVVLVPIPVTITGQGTAADTPAVDLLVIDAQDGTVKRTLSIPTPQRSVERYPTRAVAVIGDDLIFTDDGHTYRINLTTGATIWQQDKYVAVTLAANRLIGVHSNDDHTEVAQAIDPDSRTVAWTEDPTGSVSLNVQPAGPNFIVVLGIRTYKIIRTADGGIADQGKATGFLGYDLTCLYDQRSTVVCSMDSVPWTSAFDSTSGKWLWQLPDAEKTRTSIKLSAAWHGLAYGTTSNGSVILDARTGADRVPTAAIAPVLINEYLAVAYQSGLKAFPTTK